jgi:hypothetical protein
MDVIQLAEAKAKGLTRYFNGRPCKHGHLSERYVSTHACIACLYPKSKQWQRDNPEKCAESRRAWSQANPERHAAAKAAWNKANPEGQAKRSRAWFLANRKKANQATRDWQKRNGGAVSAWAAERRSALQQRVAGWADLGLIRDIYKLAQVYRQAGFDVEVDHIVPLRGKAVSGLHTHDNLQVIPTGLNRAKSNLFF